MKEKILIVNDWNIKDLYDEGFWKNVLRSTINGQNSGIDNVIFDKLFERTEKEIINDVADEVWDIWNNIPKKLKKTLFENDETVYAVWVSGLHADEIKKFQKIAKQNKYQDLYNFVLKNPVYIEIQNQKKQAFRDMATKSADSLFLQFIEKTTGEEIVSLSAPEYILLGGNNTRKVNKTKKEMIQNGFEVLYMLKVEVAKGKYIKIYIFDNKE